MDEVVKIIAFEDRQGRFIFVKVPGEYGRYVRTNISVALADCGCGSRVGEPCRGDNGHYTGSTHADRLVAAREVLRYLGVPNRGRKPDHYQSGADLQRDDIIGDDKDPGVIGQPEEPEVVDLAEFLGR